MRCRQFGLAIALLFAASCSTVARKKAPPPTPVSAQTELNRIKRVAGHERPAREIRALHKFIAHYPQGTASDEALIMLGNLYLQHQDYKNAYQAYWRIVSSPYQSSHENEARILSAKALFHLGRYDEALGLANTTLAKSDLTPAQQSQMHELRFIVEQQLGNGMDALKDIIFLASAHPQPDMRDRFRRKGLDVVDSKLNEAELEKVAASSDYGFLRPEALFRLGVMAWDQQDLSRTRDYMSSVQELAPKTDLAEKAQQYIDQIDARRKVNADTIGVILPLSGRYASIGYKSLHGIQLALGIFGPNPSKLHLAVIDSESNPDVARRAMERLIDENSVIGVIGGLLSKTAYAEAAKAQEMGVPMIALSQSASLTDVGDFIFRDSLTSQMQVDALVSIAMDRLGMKRFAIMYPNDAYGAEFSRLFWDDVVAHGGQIQGVQVYDPKETDFHAAVQKLVGTYYTDERADEYRLRLKDWKEQNASDPSALKKVPDDLLPPIVDFDALFVPDSVKAIGQIAPMLAYSDVENVRLLGTNLWNTPELIKRGQKFVEGAIFVDSFMENDPALKNTSFYHNYETTFQEDPGLFVVQAYDSALILRQLLAEGESSRIGLKERLEKLKNFTGAIGTLSMTSKHEITRPVIPLMVKDGQIIKGTF